MTEPGTGTGETTTPDTNLPTTVDKNGKEQPILSQPDDYQPLVYVTPAQTDPVTDTLLVKSPDTPRDPAWTPGDRTPLVFDTQAESAPESESEQTNDSTSSAPQVEKDPEPPVTDEVRLVSLDPPATDPTGLQDVLRLSDEEEDNATPIKEIPPPAQKETPAAQVAPSVNEPIPAQSNKQLWQVAAVVLTLTSASVLLKQIQNRAKANAAKLAALKHPFLAVPREAPEGAYVSIEWLEDVEGTSLALLSEPTQGKLTKGERSYTYQPEPNSGTSDGNNEDTFVYATTSGTGSVHLQLQTEAGQQKISHALHDAQSNYDTPVRFTVKAAKDAPTLVITDAVESTTQNIALPSLEAYTYSPNAKLKIELGQLPQGGTVSDGKHTFTTNETDTVNVTAWNLNTLTFLPPRNFNGSFTLNIRVTESRDNQADVITSASIRLNTTSGHVGTLSARGETTDTETVSTAKSASITVHSVLPNPEAKPKEMEIRYHVLNLASSRPRQNEPKPVIDWINKAPDRKISSTGWVPKLFDATKEKVRMDWVSDEEGNAISFH
jgi:hypothetical protein